jgi:hypothetical protein
MPKSATIKTGNTINLSAAITPTNATNQAVQWNSNNPAAATVDANGVVRAIGGGTAIITVTTVDGGFRAECVVTVEKPVTGVTVAPPALIMKLGDTPPQQLIEMVLPADATNLTVSWSSDTLGVATVSGSGLVTAVSLGTAKITVTTSDGGFTADCVVTVEKPTPTPMVPSYPSDATQVAADTGIDPNDLEARRDNMVYLKKGLAEKIAKDLLGSTAAPLKAASTNIIPVFSGTVSPDGRVTSVTITVKGKDLLAQHPEDVSLIGMISPNTGKLLEYVNDPLDFDDEKFTIMYGGLIYAGEINPNADYEIVAFIKDGGAFDLDGAINGKVLASIFLASESTKGGGGCSAGFGFFAFALLAAPFILRNKK